jgi:AcrR family transcriptional regulator
LSVTQTRTRSGGREALLDAAVSVIADHGWGAVTVRAVAERAKVSPGTVTYHFGSADELLVAALEHGAGHTSAMLEQLALDLQATDWDAEAWTKAFVAALAGDVAKHRENHLACFELQLLAARRPELLDSARRIQLAYARVARMALQVHGLSGTVLDIAAINLTALVTGLMMRELVDPQPGAEDRLLAALGQFEAQA